MRVMRFLQSIRPSCRDPNSDGCDSHGYYIHLKIFHFRPHDITYLGKHAALCFSTHPLTD